MQQTHRPRQATRLGLNPTRAFLLRLHSYVGVLIAPFLLIAAVTGLLFVMTPQLESLIYADALYTGHSAPGKAHSLAAQAQAAREHIHDSLDISMVRPAADPEQTTRILFSDPSLGPSENRTIFVDPYTLEIKGDMTTYGTSGTLPFRIAIDHFHRDLMLGNWGRYYSELAASWLWIIVISGTVLWATRSRRRIALRQLPTQARRRWLHGTIGVSAGVFLIFLSLTGLTWSQEAGARIKSLRAMMDWGTPSISLVLPSTTLSAAAHSDHSQHDEHATHQKPKNPQPPYDLSLREDRAAELDTIYAAARDAGIDSPYMEIRLPRPNTAWSVREYDRSWPTQVDAIALHPVTYEVTSRADFAQFGMVAKLVRWGIDAHMGILFGWPNQLLMAIVALVLVVTIVYGYRVWWSGRARNLPTLFDSWKQMSVTAWVVWLLVAFTLGWALPLVGLSLLVFVAIDFFRTRRA